MGVLHASNRHNQWPYYAIVATVPLLFAATNPAAAANPIITPLLDKAILNDLFHQYEHPDDTDSTCLSSTANTTTTTFAYPGVNAGSEWDPDAEDFEASLFEAMMSHTDENGRSWEIRIGSGGNMYSHFTEMYGETIAPQTDELWVDEISQMVSVNLQLNEEKASGYCPNTGDECPKYFIHQAGAYQRDSPYTDDAPFYSPNLAKYCSGNTCMFASWGTQAHVPTPFTSPVMYITKFTNCGNGVIEHTQVIHNFAPIDSDPLAVDQDYFNVPWSGVRSSKLPYAMEPGTDNVLTIGDANNINNVDYIPICNWGLDNDAGLAGRSVAKDIRFLGGYTTFVGEGLMVNRPTVDLVPWCRKSSDSTCSNEATCMVASCDQTQINSGYTRISLGVLSSTGPDCRSHGISNPYRGFVGMMCNMRLAKNFGQTKPYSSNADPCAPWKNDRIGFYNTVTGATLEVSYVRHWSYFANDYRVYFSVFVKDTGSGSRDQALDMVNAMFATNGDDIPIEVRTVYMSSVKPWCSVPEGCTATTASTCMVPCDDTMIASGYTQIELGVPPGGPHCQRDSTTDPYQGLVALRCDLRSNSGFGDATVEEDTPIALYNTVTGKTLQVAFIKHWSLNLHGNEMNPELCLLVKTGSALYNNGYVEVLVDSGNGFVSVNDGDYKYGEVVVNQCFTDIVNVQVKSTSNNAWTGSILVSEDNEASYYPMSCDDCTGTSNSTSEIVVEADSDGGSQATTQCHNSGTEPCTLTYHRRPICLLVTTGGETHNDGYVEVLVDNGNGSGFVSVNNGQTLFAKNEVVVDECFTDIVNVQVKGTSNNGWVGSIVLSQDYKESYYPMTCDDCESTTTTTADIAVDGNSDSGHVATTHCLGGSACTLTYHDHTVYFSVDMVDDAGGVNMTEAINEVNTLFANNGVTTSPIGIRSPTEASPVPLSYDPALLPSFTHVYGKGEQYSNGGVAGYGRRRVGSAVDTRDFTILTVNWMGGAKLQPGDTYHNRGFMVSSDLGSVQDLASGLVDETHVAEIAQNDWNPRAIHIYQTATQTGSSFAAVAASSAGGNTASCSSTSALTPVFSGLSTPSIGHVPFFYVTCGTTATYFGPDPYHFAPSFGAAFPNHGNEKTKKNCILVKTGGDAYNDGYVRIYVDSGSGFEIVNNGGYKFAKNQVVVDQCFDDIVKVQVEGTSDNAWVGSIEVSEDYKASYSPLTCDNCDGTSNMTAKIAIEADGNCGACADTRCHNGNLCTLTNHPKPVCLLVTTGSAQYYDGYLKVLVDSGSGFFSVNNGGTLFNKNQVVVDQCFTDIVNVQVEGTSNNAWVGSILVSKDNKASYSALACDDCDGTTKTTAKIAIEKDGNCDACADTRCHNGNQCTLSFPLVCLRVKTGTGAWNDGYVEVLVDSGSGFVSVNNGGTLFAKNQVVVDQCFTDIVDVQVRGTSDNAWVGSIEVSTDNKVSYSPLVCANCTGPTTTTAKIAIEADGNCGACADTQCHNGNLCTLPFQPLCLLVTTGSATSNAGYVEVLVDSGNGSGFVSLNNGQTLFATNEVVVDECFTDIVNVQVKGTDDDAWTGSILLSADHRVSYHPLLCEDCTGTTSTTAKIVVEADHDGASQATTRCHCGQPCTLPVHAPPPTPTPPNSNEVRSYVCEEEENAILSWKLMGFFDQCTSRVLETATYDETLC